MCWRTLLRDNFFGLGWCTGKDCVPAECGRRQPPGRLATGQICVALHGGALEADGGRTPVPGASTSSVSDGKQVS